MSETGFPYTQKELHAIRAQPVFTGANLSEIAFPLGGIGTGTISLGGRGNLRDFEIQNHPDKGNVIPFTFFALWAKAAGEDPIAMVLEGRTPPPYREAGGESPNQLVGLPRFREATFVGKYPNATVNLTDSRMPVHACLNAWNPFIPLNVHDSALPVALFEWTFTNESAFPVEISLAASMSNSLQAQDGEGELSGAGPLNQARQSGPARGIFYAHPDAAPAAPTTGTMALTSSWAEMEIVPQWYRGGWFDKSHIFWDSFAATGTFKTEKYNEGSRSGDVGSLILHADVPSHGSVTIPVILTWHFPHVKNPWINGAQNAPVVLNTYISTHFESAWTVAEYVQQEMARLKRETNCWRETIFSSSLPDHVLGAVTSQASIMRTNTCYLLSDGRFFGWEGTWAKEGSCHGSCTHVWNYEQAVAFLFPELERSMRRTEFLDNTRASGNMAFRTNLPPGLKLWSFKPCADGQMGTIIQLYRDWQLSGDDRFLKLVWPNVKLALEYAWTMTPVKMEAGDASPINSPSEEKRSIDSLWDPDKDGLMEGEQHNTYDIEFYGPNTMCTAMYLGALRACERIALYLGEPDKAEEYRAVFESGRAKVDSELWNGEYYIQKVDVIADVTVPEVLRTPPVLPDATSSSTVGRQPGNEVLPKYQYGEGCLSDQLLGQWAAHVAGLGYLLDREHVRSAVRSVFRYNFRSAVGADANVQRVYALNDEAGLLLCSWPHGNRPTLPFVYSDEVWTGIEYHVASHLIYEGWIDEGLTIVKAISERYSGYNRNPWNQIECGYHYARAMSSWSVKLALDGYEYSAPEKRLGFAPKINAQEYQTFWSTASSWGTYRQNLAEKTFALDVHYGAQTIQRFDIRDLPQSALIVTGPQGTLSATRSETGLLLVEAVTLSAGESLLIVAS